MNPCRKFTLLWSIWRPKEQQQKCYTFRHHSNSRNVDHVKLLNTAIKQTLISISSEPDRSKSLWITTQLTLPSCLESVCMGNMVSRFQIWKKKKTQLTGPESWFEKDCCVLVATSFFRCSLITAHAWRNEGLFRVPLPARYWLVLKTTEMNGSETPATCFVN